MQFLTWTYAEHNVWARILWKILATPLIYALGAFTNQYFWVVMSLNSVVWAAVLTYIMSQYRSRLS